MGIYIGGGHASKNQDTVHDDDGDDDDINIQVKEFAPGIYENWTSPWASASFCALLGGVKWLADRSVALETL